MIDFTYDDGGRASAGRRPSGDCVVRAAAILTGRPYMEVYRMAAELNKERGTGRRSARNGLSWVLTADLYRALGLVRIRTAGGPGGKSPTYSQAHYRHGDCIAQTAKHAAALVGGALRDTFDGRTYNWEGETRERKTFAIWRKK